MSSENNKEEDKKRSLFGRILQAGTGLGIIRGNITPLKAHALGGAQLWHGTPVENMDSIIQTGLSTEFAGANKRLNSVLLKEGLMRDTLDLLKSKGVKVTPELNKNIYNKTEELFSKIKLSDKSLTDAIIDNVDDMAKTVNIPKEELKDFISKKMSEHGKRLYFGKTPSSVSFWSNKGKNELHYAMDKAQQEFEDIARKANNKSSPGFFSRLSNAMPDNIKQQAKITGIVTAEQTTGGMYNDVLARIRYGTPKEKVTINTIKELPGILKNHQNSNVVFRTSIPTKTVAHMKDFPGVRHLVASLPGLKSLLAYVIPNSDPSKDISIAENVGSEYINKAHVVDKKTGKVLKEINIKNFKKHPINLFGGEGFRAKNLKAAIIPGVLTLAGGNMIYKALKGDMEKEANLGTAAKITGGTAAMFTLPYLAAMVARKARGVEIPESSGNIATDLKTTGNYSKRVTPFVSPLTTAGGAGLGALLSPNKTLRIPSALLGAYFGAALAGVTGQIPTLSKNIKEDPKGSVLFTRPLMESKKYREFAKNNPEGASAIEGLSAAAVTPTLYLAAKKFYPAHSTRIGEIVDKTISASTETLKKDPEFLKKLNRYGIPLIIAMALAGSGVSYLGGALQEGVGRAGEMAGDKIKDKLGKK